MTAPLFGSWLAETRSLQLEAYATDPAALEGERRADYVRAMAYALADELHEATDEIQWKTWGKDQGAWIDRDAFVKEFVDLLHFAANLLVMADCTDEELTGLYEAKMSVNRARMLGVERTGYDSVATKCPHCRRALDDTGTEVRWRTLQGVYNPMLVCRACRGTVRVLVGENCPNCGVRFEMGRPHREETLGRCVIVRKGEQE